MPLLMLDLDNTLIDRDAAFLASARAFLAEHRLPAADLGWIAELDAGGYTPDDRMAAAIADRYGSSAPTSAVDALLHNGGADLVVLAESTRRALARARADGWTCVIVTNGATVQQEAKIRRTGLDRIVQGWVVSEAIGHKKPGPEIFRAAAEAVGHPLSGAWMVGDSAHADIAGAHALGLRSVWVSAGRPWAQDAYRPTLVAEDVATAIGHAVGGATAQR
ncbi:HAD family hydrolase [Kitasatospora sp. NPDC050463]|uniref:HAD family hydrolase n=1 Tax=Kitasatospora sp. NPDC050463 TaxID=3155786 RepID=UPI0033F44F80